MGGKENIKLEVAMNIIENKPSSDLKETMKRRKELLQISLFILLLNGIIKTLSGLILSTYLIVTLFVIIILLIFTNSKGLAKFTKVALIISLCIFLVSLSIVEGLGASAHYYFIPLIIALPAIIENNRKSYLEIIAYFSLIIICFCFCLFFGDERSGFQNISEDVLNLLNLINNTLVVILCTTFSFLNVYNERKYVKAIIDEKSKAEEAGFAKIRFLSSMGHELRTPLNGIIGATSLLRKEASLKPKIEYLDILQYCSNHMLQLVDDLLDFNKIEGGKFRLNPVIFNLKSLLNQCYVTFNNRFEEKRVQLRFTVDEKLNTGILADDTRLIQIFNNLISNAWKFTENGYVEVSAKVQEETTEQLLVDFRVTDTGIGIDPVSKEKIFESFWQVYHKSTRKYSGTGLGLAISQNILKMMGSSLQVESRVNQGTTFYFSATFTKAATAVEESVVLPVHTDLSGLKIIIAEDNPINMLIAKKMLIDQNAVISTANNGLELLETLSKDSSFDIILLDLEMPVMDGYTAIKELVKLYPATPVLAFTASLLDKEMIEDLLNLGFSDYILKPVTSAELERKIKENSLRSTLAISE